MSSPEARSGQQDSPGANGQAGLVPTFIPLREIIFVRERVYENDARVFLDFALDAAQDFRPRGRVEALSNSKRAINNRVDTLVYKVGLAGFARRQRWGLPEKIRRLKQLGLSTPSELEAVINKHRNYLEHDYIIPPEGPLIGEVLTAASLYLRNTEHYFEDGVPKALIFSTHQSADTSIRVSRPATGYSTAELDLERDNVSFYGQGRSAERLPIADLGPGIMTAMFQIALEATLTRTAELTRYATVKDFMRERH